MRSMYASKSWCMAAKAWRTMKATPCLLPLCCRTRTYPSSRWKSGRNSFAGEWRRSRRLRRIERSAPCPYFGVCGGCDYQHIPYELQLRYKAEILRETLARLGRVHWDGPIVPHASPPFAYRNRVQWKIAADARGVRDIGYFQAGSQKLCAIRQCPIASPKLNETLGAIVNLLEAGKLAPGLREIEAFADQDDDRLLLNLAVEDAKGASPQMAALFRSTLPAVDSLLIHDQRTDNFELFGPGYINYRVGRAQLSHRASFVFPGEPVRSG